jgi:phage minor structural protein
MIKIYDLNNKLLKIIDVCKNLCIISDLEKGTQSLSFSLPKTRENMNLAVEEYYVETSDYRYVIKEVNYDDSDFIEIYCTADTEELNRLLTVFDAFDINIETCCKKILSQISSSWSVSFKSSNNSVVEYKEQFLRASEALDKVKEDYNLEMFYDTRNKVVEVYDQRGSSRGLFMMDGVNATKLIREGQTYDFCTVVYPIGKDGLTIADINNGKDFIENYEYCNKYIPYFLKLDDIETKEQLKFEAEMYLEKHCKPIVSYEVGLNKLPEGIEIGDSLLIIDSIRKTRDRQRVVKITHYPFTPEKDSVEFSNRLVSLERLILEMQKDTKKQVEYVKNNLQ